MRLTFKNFPAHFYTSFKIDDLDSGEGKLRLHPAKSGYEKIADSFYAGFYAGILESL